MGTTDRRTMLAGIGALSAALAALSCCIPLLPFVAAAGIAGSAAFLLSVQPYLLAASVALIAYGFFQMRRAKQCDRRPGVASAAMLWTSTAFVALVLLFPQLLASLLAG
jgi:hypothetical protein